MKRRTILKTVIAAGLSGTVAGCMGGDGGGDGGGSQPTETPTETAEPTPTRTPEPTETAMTSPTPTQGSMPTAQEAYPNYNWSQLEGVQPTATTTVTLRNFAFHPLIAAVSPGTTVTFTNEDSTTHTVTIPKLGVDKTLSGGGSATVTFAEAGTYGYVCTFHGPSMLGRVVVGESIDTSGEGAATPTATPTDGGGGNGGGNGGGGYY